MAIEQIKVTCTQKREIGPDNKPVFKKLDKPIEGVVSYEIPASMDEAKAQLGEAISTSLIQQKLRIFVQDTWRRLVAAGTDPALATTQAQAAKPGLVTRTPADPKATAVAALSGMTPEERKAFIASLAEMAKSMK